MATPMLDQLLDEIMNSIMHKGLKSQMLAAVSGVAKLVHIITLESLSPKDKDGVFGDLSVVTRSLELRGQAYANLLGYIDLKSDLKGFSHMRANMIEMLKTAIDELKDNKTYLKEAKENPEDKE